MDQIRAIAVPGWLPEMGASRRGQDTDLERACATAGGRWTIAMALSEAGGSTGYRCEIHAADGSSAAAAIAKGKPGRYRQRAMRGLPEACSEILHRRRGERRARRPPGGSITSGVWDSI